MNGLLLAMTPLVLICLFLGCWLAVYWSRRPNQRLISHSVVWHHAPLPVLPYPAKATCAGTAKVEGLTLREAEDLLDWLESIGFKQRELFCDECSSFAVEFRMDEGHGLALGPHRPQTIRRYSVG